MGIKTKISLINSVITNNKSPYIEAMSDTLNPPAFILVTAHRDYAVEVFEVNAVDYLMKPVSFSRLLEALQRF